MSKSNVEFHLHETQTKTSVTVAIFETHFGKIQNFWEAKIATATILLTGVIITVMFF